MSKIIIYMGNLPCLKIQMNGSATFCYNHFFKLISLRLDESDILCNASALFRLVVIKTLSPMSQGSISIQRMFKIIRYRKFAMIEDSDE